MRHHDLKCWPGPFEAVRSGQKLHEVRFNDRAYAAGDTVTLKEWDPAPSHGSKVWPVGFTGQELEFTIGHVSEAGTWGLPPLVCVFTLLKLLGSRIFEARP